MSGATTSVPGTSGTSTLVRATFAPGMLLQHDDLERVQAYPGELSRLLFRSLFGCGVVCGLEVAATAECGKVFVTVAAGLGLSCAGDPIYVPKDVRFPLADDCDPTLNGTFWVVLCRKVKRCVPRPAMCGCDDEEPATVRTREREAFEIRAVPDQPPCACVCEPHEPSDSTCHCVDPEHPCYKDHYAGVCFCRCKDDSESEGECIVLAKLDGEGEDWKVDHAVRRFIRPVLARDPQVPVPPATTTDKGRHRQKKTGN